MNTHTPRWRERERNLLRNSKRGGSDVRDLKFVGNEWIRCRRECEEQGDVDKKEEEEEESSRRRRRRHCVELFRFSSKKERFRAKFLVAFSFSVILHYQGT